MNPDVLPWEQPRRLHGGGRARPSEGAVSEWCRLNDEGVSTHRIAEREWEAEGGEERRFSQTTVSRHVQLRRREVGEASVEELRRLMARHANAVVYDKQAEERGVRLAGLVLRYLRKLEGYEE